MSDWQPIESAPRDGTNIVLACGPLFDPMFAIGSWHDGYDAEHARRHAPPGEEREWLTKPGWTLWWTETMRKHDWPTHWMPLPELPEDCR